MKTTHRIYFQNAADMSVLADESVDLVVTSPPYPMIGMWDDLFVGLEPKIVDALDRGDGKAAFEGMHTCLDPVWQEIRRVMKPGGVVCVNIGDATRSLNGVFQLFVNHARILNRFLELGFQALPAVLWRKPTNAPNKFMGSGMLPPGAYVTLEHEYILILRKGDKREFRLPADKANRSASAYFWEERNVWFSDVWTGLVGIRQELVDRAVRERSGSFPFELAYRLVNMFSVKGDTVLDPFFGLGTTGLAAMTAARNSVGFELETAFDERIQERVMVWTPFANDIMRDRLSAHLAFVRQRKAEGKVMKHVNERYEFPVVTRQETALFLNPLDAILPAPFGYEAVHSEIPQTGFGQTQLDLPFG